MKRVSLVSLVVLLPLYVACTATSASKPASGAAAPSGASQQLTVKAMDTMKFDWTTLTAKTGQPIQLTLDNSSGQIAHDFDITEGVPQPIKISAQPGQKATGTFTIDTPGTYTYFCSQPGHEQAGMKGTLTVQQRSLRAGATLISSCRGWLDIWCEHKQRSWQGVVKLRAESCDWYDEA